MRIRIQQGRSTIWTPTRWIAFGVVAVAMLLEPGPSRAIQPASRDLRSVAVEVTDKGFDLDLRFDVPIRILRYAPQTTGNFVRIELDPFARGATQLERITARESLPIPRQGSVAVSSIVYDRTNPTTAVVELQFTRSFDFEIEEGADFRSLILHLQRPAPTARPSPVPASVDPGARGSELLSRARHAIRDGENELAIALLTRVLELSETDAAVSVEDRMTASELLGLTHERMGQMAHARADYEDFLETYPEGPAATRVRQRLDALLTANGGPSKDLRQTTRRPSGDGAPGIRRELFGSLGARIFQAETLPDDSGDDFNATNAFTDMDITGRLDANSWAIQGDFNGAYDFDLAGEGRSDDLLVSRLSVELDDRAHGFEGVVGRQRRSDSGVLGRFDGVRLAADLGSHYEVSVLAGMPVKRTYDSSLNTDTLLVASALDWKGLGLPGLQGQLFLAGRWTAGLTDRAAIGGEVRYSGARTSSFLYLDYDFSFDSLNTFVISTTFHATPDTDLRAYVERRNSPVLTLSTALLGQPVDNLEDLQDLYSDSEIRDLALDRTASIWSGTVGATQRLGGRYQLSLDLNVSRISGTDTAAGVSGTDPVGPDFGGTVQFLVSDWLARGGVGSVAVSYFDGDYYRSLTTSSYARFVLPYNIRLRPRVLWQWRDSQLLGQQSLLRPSMEVDWQHGPFQIDVEAGVEWNEPISGAELPRQESYFVEAGVRWEF